MVFQARILEWVAIFFSYIHIYVYIYETVYLCVCVYIYMYERQPIMVLGFYMYRMNILIKKLIY